MAGLGSAPLTRALLGSWLLVQLVLALFGPGLAGFVWEHYGLVPLRLYGLVPLRLLAAWHGQLPLLPALITLVSHQFLHGGWAHLGLNALFFAAVGPAVEQALGPRRLALLFLVSGVAGGLAEVLASPASIAPVVGASGAISGVFAGYALLYGRSQPAARRVAGITLSSDLLNALWLAVSWFGLQWASQLVFGAEGRTIAIWSHIGGFLAGLVLTPILSQRRG
jgi:membrane associated rhomboid family serine protease